MTLLVLGYVLVGTGACMIVLKRWRPVGWPILGELVVFAGFLSVLWRRSAIVPIHELGIVYGFMVLVYSIMPLIEYLQIGQEYSPWHDIRLYALQPTPEEVASIGWRNVFYLLSFAVGYTLVRGNVELAAVKGQLRGSPRLYAILTVMVIVLSWWLISAAFGYPRTASEYVEGYVTDLRIPLLWRQLASKIHYIGNMLNVCLLIVLFSRYNRYRLWIAVFLGYNACITLSKMWSLTGLALQVLASVLLYHRFVRPLRLPILVLIAVLGIYGCLAYGIARAQRYSENVDIRVDTVLSSSSEFDAMFGTALHLLKYKEAGALPPVPWQAHFNDILALVPQQLLPVEKVSFQDWYMVTFYFSLHEAGRGLNFGVLPETILGLGNVQLIIYGLALGVVFAWLHRMVSRRCNSFWSTAFYLWLCVQSYSCYRNTQFVLLPNFVYHFAPLFLMLQLFPSGKLRLRKSANWGRRTNAPVLLHS